MREIGAGVGSTGACVTFNTGARVASIGDTVGVPVGLVEEICVGSFVGGWVRICVGAFDGDSVVLLVGNVVFGSAGEVGDGVGVSIGATGGGCQTGASAQISLPPITSTGVISAHC